MTDGEVTLSMAVPLDSDGFLRRECPTCGREFKWLPTPDDDDEATDMADGGYFCPYCGVQAPADAWLTEAQIALAERIVAAQVAEPMLQRFANDLSGRFRQAGTTTVQSHASQAEEPDRLTEEDDMTRFDFTCHPSEPLKILNDWHRPVYCLVCGEARA